MPTTTFTNPDRTLLLAYCNGHVAPQDVIGWNVESKIDANGENGFVTVVDLTDITGTDMSFEDINAVYGKLVRHYEPRNQKLSLYLLAPDDLAFGMTRILQSLSGMSDSIVVDVFRDLDSLGAQLPHAPSELARLRLFARRQATQSDDTPSIKAHSPS